MTVGDKVSGHSCISDHAFPVLDST